MHDIKRSLDAQDVQHCPFSQFELWYKDAEHAGLDLPEAMSLATATPTGRPSVRTVLCKQFGLDGFVFFTNYESSKSEQLIANPYAELLFHWTTLERQVRIFGAVKKISTADSTAYFHSRPRGSQIGAWISPQSQVIVDRDVLTQAYKERAADFGDEPIPLPPHWGGFRVVPEMFEFWQGRESRIHDRICYQKTNDEWNIVRLAP